MSAEGSANAHSLIAHDQKWARPRCGASEVNPDEATRYVTREHAFLSNYLSAVFYRFSHSAATCVAV